MKYNVGDKVRIKSLDWYNENKGNDGIVEFSTSVFVPGMSQFCGKVVTIEAVFDEGDDDVIYCMEEIGYDWTDEMFEGIEKEEISLDIDDFQDDNEILDIIDEYVHRLKGNECQIHLPDGYIFKDENGNVINATKIVLEKKEDTLQLESIKMVREYWSEHARIFIEIYPDNTNECIFTHLWVVDGHRRKGYGKQTLMQAESIAKGLGCYKVYLKVETDSWMHKWYLRSGYKLHGLADEGYTWLTKNLNQMVQKDKELLLSLATVVNKGHELIPHKDYEIKQDGDRFYLVKKKKGIRRLMRSVYLY